MAVDLDTTRPLTVSPTLDAYRRWGYLAADLDPFGRLLPEAHPELAGEGPEVEQARAWYSGSLAVEFMHIPDVKIRQWIAARMEAEPETSDRERILDRLLRADVFEEVLQRRYLGTKRFSIEGVTGLNPLLGELLDSACRHEASQAVLAMSHRGRLNVMHNIIGRPAKDLFAGFEDVDPESVQGGGDVKYHMGATGEWRSPDGRSINLHLASNPSHLEAVNSVVMGRVRAKQDRLRRTENEAHPEAKVVPIIMHGDAAFAGQGVVAEALNFLSLDGFGIGGTINVVVDNWIGFTTEPKALWSWRFSTDVAKRLPIPIFHVNGEDPDAIVRAARIAADFRWTFGTDVVIDMIGYRRHGHSEVDDPTITQPKLYAIIKDHPRLYRSYAKTIGMADEALETGIKAYEATLDDAQDEAAQMTSKPVLADLPPYWNDYAGGPWKSEFAVSTTVDADRLQAVADAVTTPPKGFNVHRKVQRLLDQRAKMGRGEQPVDYGMAEALAFGTLVTDQVPVRMSGQDSRRATFNQRHAVLIDIEDASEYLPLQHVGTHLGVKQAKFEIYDSMLSEAAVLGYEYGYSRDYPESLVLWEAQFGDFVNGAQIMIDQFVSAAEDKWKLLSGLVMLLPHGFEGQGPEHSSARIERFLQLSAEHNMQVCQPTTAAQYFHLLRRQALSRWRKPLIVFTPKSMLRAKAASSPIDELSSGAFQQVIPDAKLEGADRIVIATGKLVHELRAQRETRGLDRTAILALDQIYPFPEAELVAELERHPEFREIVWAQEEPANMGALSFVMHRLQKIAGDRPVRSVKRAASASPATGSAKAHQMEQETLLEWTLRRWNEG